MRSKRFLLLALSFIEGASVMACELFSAKLIAPFFGSSLYVWAAVLGVTLSALMLGYYVGGYISEKSKRDDVVFWVLLFAGLLLAVMPFTAFWSMSNFIDFSVQWGSTLSLIIFMFPPLFLMGTTSPLIINLMNTAVEFTGKTAGSIYAISTLGGIFATFLVGFYLLPEYGIKWPCLFFGVILSVVPFYMLLKRFFFKKV